MAPPIPNVADGDTITTAWGNDVADTIGGLETTVAAAYHPGGTDVAVADGGTGASSASAARTNLGLVIGTNVQAFDADLSTIGATYTEGTFTPGLAFATPGTSSFTGVTAAGFYLRMGNRVWFHGVYVATLTKGTAAGQLNFTGLPVASNATTNSGSFVSTNMQGWTKAGYTSVQMQVPINGTTGLFRASGSGQAIAILAAGDMTDGTVRVEFAGSYMV